MKIADTDVSLSELDLKELFQLFCSCTAHELAQIYDTDSGHYFEDVRLEEEYNLNMEKREFAIDAVRATLYFLHRRGFALTKDGVVHRLDPIVDFFG